MAPIASEAAEEARRALREGEDSIGARRSIPNEIDGILATLASAGDRGLRRKFAANAGSIGWSSS